MSNSVKQLMSKDLQNNLASNQRLLIFDPYHTGHHAGYIQYLLEYGAEHLDSTCIDILVSPSFIQKHRKLVDLSQIYRNINFVTLSDQANTALEDDIFSNSLRGRIWRSLRQWEILKTYAKELQSSHCLIMYFDSVLMRFCLPTRFPCSFSGIYFRPILHYNEFSCYVQSGRELLWTWRDKLCLSGLLKSPQLHTLFCLDPFAVNTINQLDRSKDRAVYLQDPIKIYPRSPEAITELKADLYIAPGRKVFLLFGALAQRKGIHQVIQAFQQLPDEICNQCCLLLVGTVAPEDEMQLESGISALTDKPLQIVRQHTFIPHELVQTYFDASDVILAPYQRHIGMSGILIHAAVAQKPVLASDFGLMGEITRRYQLGSAVDTTSAGTIRDTIIQFIKKPESIPYNLPRMQEFAEMNRAEDFASRVFQTIGVGS
jgi:glycosyltransferase involved in cell wall biosynthesis